MYTFDYTRNNEEDIKLEYCLGDLELQAELYFHKAVKKDCLSDVIAELAGQFHEEAEANAAYCLLGKNNNYIWDLLLKNEDVIAQAENAAIELYEGRDE